jgi:hypothetical protein
MPFMGKYSHFTGINDDVKIDSLIAIANELAEANRLKRFEVMMKIDLSDLLPAEKKFNMKQLEDHV